jgi:putative membrane protein
MKSNKFFTPLLLCFALLAGNALADASNPLAGETIDSESFMEEIYQNNLAEVELGKLALEESGSDKVKAFAQLMIDEHKSASVELKKLAQRKKFELPDDTSLINKTKKQILSLRDDESFDLAYASNQVRAHELTLQVFQRGQRSDDAEILAFAEKYLPMIEKHLIKARQLVQVTERSAQEADVESDLDIGDNPPTSR